MVPRLKPYAHMRRALYQLHEAGYDNAIIAGGAIRDMYHDVVITDVDIFVKYKVTDGDPRRTFQHEEWNQRWADLFVQDSTMADVGWEYSSYGPPQDDESSEDTGKNGLLAVWSVATEDEFYQVIFTSMDPVDYVNRKFDFGICKAYFDGNKIHYSRDFMRDSRNRTITLVGEGLSHSQIRYACEHHLPRIQRKYPGYKFLVESSDGSLV